MCHPFAAAAKIRAKVWDRDMVRIRVRVSINNNDLSAAELTDKYHSATPANARHLAWRIFCRCSIVLLFYLPRKVSLYGKVYFAECGIDYIYFTHALSVSDQKVLFTVRRSFMLTDSV